MINDNQTYKVYFAEGLKSYGGVFYNILSAFNREGVPMDYLPLSKSPRHIWARDYMPVQLSEERFLKYTYKPDYLKGAPEWIPNYRGMARALSLKCKSTPIILDGGNIVRYGERVIMTDKVFLENPHFSRMELTLKLEDLLEATVTFIPWDRYEPYGHADGMVRFIDRTTVLLNCYSNVDPGLRKRLLDALSGRFAVEELHFSPARPSRMSWAYLNFLQTCLHIFVPGLGIREDEEAIEQIKSFYPGYKVVPIPGCQELAKEGGALNCVSWNVWEKVQDGVPDVLPAPQSSH